MRLNHRPRVTDQLVVMGEEEVGLVPAEPYRGLIAPYLIFGGPGGS